MSIGVLPVTYSDSDSDTENGNVFIKHCSPTPLLQQLLVGFRYAYFTLYM